MPKRLRKIVVEVDEIFEGSLEFRMRVYVSGDPSDGEEGAYGQSHSMPKSAFETDFERVMRKMVATLRERLGEQL